jgi:adenylate cyclase
LEGSVQKMDSQVRVTVQLVDATTGYYLWAERYDRPLTDIFTLQNEIRRKIITAMKVKLTKEERERFRHSPTSNLEAYDYYLRGVESWWQWTKESNAQARLMFEKAVELDPMYAAAYGGLGRTYFNDWFFLWNQDLAQSLEQAREMAQQAIALDNSLPGLHQLLGYISLWNKQYEQAIAEAKRAIALDPNAADGYVNLANILALTGRPKESIGLIEKAMRLNPRAPAWYLLSLGFAYRVAGRYEEAITLLKRVLALDPEQVPAHFSLAICYAELGQREEARAEAAAVLKLNPHYSLEVWKQRLPFKDPAVLERQLAALRKAGLR